MKSILATIIAASLGLLALGDSPEEIVETIDLNNDKHLPDGGVLNNLIEMDTDLFEELIAGQLE